MSTCILARPPPPPPPPPPPVITYRSVLELHPGSLTRRCWRHLRHGTPWRLRVAKEQWGAGEPVHQRPRAGAAPARGHASPVVLNYPRPVGRTVYSCYLRKRGAPCPIRRTISRRPCWRAGATTARGRARRHRAGRARTSPRATRRVSGPPHRHRPRRPRRKRCEPPNHTPMGFNSSLPSQPRVLPMGRTCK